MIISIPRALSDLGLLVKVHRATGEYVAVDKDGTELKGFSTADAAIAYLLSTFADEIAAQ